MSTPFPPVAGEPPKENAPVAVGGAAGLDPAGEEKVVPLAAVPAPVVDPNTKPVAAGAAVAEASDFAADADAPNAPNGEPNVILVWPNTKAPVELEVVVAVAESVAGFGGTLVAPKVKPPVEGGDEAMLPKLKPTMNSAMITDQNYLDGAVQKRKIETFLFLICTKKITTYI